MKWILQFDSIQISSAPFEMTLLKYKHAAHPRIIIFGWVGWDGTFQNIPKKQYRSVENKKEILPIYLK